MNDVLVVLNGVERKLFFDLESRGRVEALFPQGDGSPGSLFTLVRNHYEKAGSIRVHIACLWASLFHPETGKEWTMDKVAAEIKQHIQSGGDIRDLNTEVYRVILQSGALGKIFTVKEKEPGKEQESR